MQENICKKWDITQEELKEGVDRFCSIGVPKYAGNTIVLMAMLELLTNGDIINNETDRKTEDGNPSDK